MAHFAELDGNYVVTKVIVINNETIDNLPFPESEPVGIAFCQSLFGPETVWLQTSYNANYRKNYASIGGSYLQEYDAFIAPSPGPNWVLNMVTFQWEPASEMPPVLDGNPPEVI